MIRWVAGDTKPLDVVLDADLSEAKTVLFKMTVQLTETGVTGLAASGNCELLDEPNAVRFKWPAPPQAGLYYGQWKVTRQDGTTETTPSGEYESIRILPQLG